MPMNLLKKSLRSFGIHNDYFYVICRMDVRRIQVQLCQLYSNLYTFGL